MKSIVKSSLVAFMLMAPYGFADSKSEVASLTNTILEKLEMPEDSPDWLKRTTFSIAVEEDFKPVWEIETVQPIYQFSPEDMFFWQFHAMTRDSVETYNFGLGYRNIINPEIMLGVNSFYDYQDENNHTRWSVGLEAIGKQYEFRANRYMAISDKKEVDTDEWEEVLGGWDVEVGGQIIPNSKLRTYVSYSKWLGIKADDLEQTAIKFEYPLNDSIDFEVKYTHDSEEQADYIDKDRLSAQVAISLGKKSKESQNLKYSENLKDKLLIPVKREHEIVLEKTTTLTVSVRRGN